MTAPVAVWAREILAAVGEARTSHRTTVLDLGGAREVRHAWVCGCGAGRDPLDGGSLADVNTEMDEHECAAILDVLAKRGVVIPPGVSVQPAWGWRARRRDAIAWGRVFPARDRASADLAALGHASAGSEAETVSRWMAVGEGWATHKYWSPSRTPAPVDTACVPGACTA